METVIPSTITNQATMCHNSKARNMNVHVHENLKSHRYTRWFKYDRDWFVCKQAALRSSCATLRE